MTYINSVNGGFASYQAKGYSKSAPQIFRRFQKKKSESNGCLHSLLINLPLESREELVVYLKVVIGRRTGSLHLLRRETPRWRS